MTLLETLLALGIIALISGISVYYLRQGGPQRAINSVARDLAVDLRSAAERAVTEQIRHSVRFDLAQENYQVVRLSDPEEILFTKNLPAAVTFQSTTLPSNAAEFTILGAAVDSGALTLRHNSGLEKTIEIRPSGYARILP